MKYKLDIQYFAVGTVTYKPNGGSGEEFTTTDGLVAACPFTPPTGKEFLRWSIEQDGSGMSYNPEDSIDGDKTLYAQWIVSSDIYNITYDSNGGMGVMQNTTKRGGDSCVIAPCGFVYQGHVFNGWNTASNGTGTPYSPNSLYTADADLLLYAQWGTVESNVKFRYGPLDNLPQSKTAGTLYFADASDDVADTGRLYFDASNEKRILVGGGDAMYVTNTTNEPSQLMYLVGTMVQGLSPGVSSPVTKTFTNSNVYMERGVIYAYGYESNGQVYIPITNDGTLASDTWPLVIGIKTGKNLAIDNDEIQARNNGAASILYLNNEGGTVVVGEDGLRTSGQVMIEDTTASTSTITGAEVIKGGLGVAGNIYFGGTLNGRQLRDATSAATIEATNKYITSRAVYYGLPAINGTKNYDSSLDICVPVTTGQNGYVLTAKTEMVGGVATALPPVWTSLATASPSAHATEKSIAFIDTISQNDSGKITATKKQIREATDQLSGIVSTGAQLFGGTKTFKNNVLISDTTVSTSRTTGALVVNGGIGVTGAMYVEGGVHATVTGNLIGNAESATQVNHDLIIGSKHYNGSEPQEITSSDLAIASPMVFKGITTTNIECTKDPVTQEVLEYNQNPVIQLKASGGGTTTVTAEVGWTVIVESTGNEYVWYEVKVPTHDSKAIEGKSYYGQTRDIDGNVIYYLLNIPVGQNVPSTAYEDGGQWTPLGFASSYALHNHGHGLLNNAGYVLDEPTGTTYPNTLLISDSSSLLKAGAGYYLKNRVTGDSSFTTLTNQTIYAAKDIASGYAGRLGEFTNDNNNVEVQLYNVGDESTPIYFKNGVPVVCDGEIGGGGGGIEIRQWSDDGTSYVASTEPIILNRMTQEQYHQKTLDREIDPAQYYLTDEVVTISPDVVTLFASSQPDDVTGQTLWIDKTTTPWSLKFYNGTKWEAINTWQ